jgi:phospholipid/cholesterol/gamma-HCH transport system substrate-binding protein
MSGRTNNYKLGVFVLAGLALFVAGLFAFGARHYFQPSTLFETYSTGDVAGLSVGSPVSLRGVSVGRVSKIGFVWSEYPQTEQRKVLIQFEIPNPENVLHGHGTFSEVLDAEIKRGLRARVQGQGITGTSFIALDYLDPYANPPPHIDWIPNHYYIPNVPSQISEILTALQRILDNLQNVRLDETLAKLNGLLDSFHQLTSDLGDVKFDRLGANADSLLTELRQSNQQLQETLTLARATIDRAELPAVTEKIRALAQRFSESAESLQKLLGGQNGEDLHQTLANARAATAELDGLLRNLRQRPSELLFSRPAPPATSMEPPPRK